MEIDPKTVREIAQKFLLDPHMTASDLKALVRDAAGADASDETFSAWYDAVRADARKGRVETVASWPDEQQPAEATGGEQVQDGAASEAVIRLERWLSARQANVYEGISSTCVTAEPRDRTTAAYTIAESDLRAVLAERNALAARVAELEGERDLWRTRAYQVGNMLIGERDPEVVPFLGVPCQEPTAPEPEES